MSFASTHMMQTKVPVLFELHRMQHKGHTIAMQFVIKLSDDFCHVNFPCLIKTPDSMLNFKLVIVVLRHCCMGKIQWSKMENTWAKLSITDQCFDHHVSFPKQKSPKCNERTFIANSLSECHSMIGRLLSGNLVVSASFSCISLQSMLGVVKTKLKSCSHSNIPVSVTNLTAGL